jgi:large subunit ribosomal protein L17
MRHGKKFNHLSRKKAHRKALLKNMAISLIEHKRINTTLAKAKALRKYIEPLLTRARKAVSEEKIKDATHHRRIVFSYLQNKDAVKTLFGEIAMKIADRPGGYVRVLRTGFREKDAAEMCIIEFVDYNSDALETKTSSKKRTRRSRKKKSSDSENTSSEETNLLPEDNEDTVADNENNSQEEE